MRNLTKSVAGVSGLLLASGCAVLPSAPNLTVVPHETVRLGTSAANGQYQLAKYYFGQQRYALALIAFTRALEYDPKHADARNGRATVLVELGDMKAAADELRKALEIEPKAVHLLNNLGYVQMLDGDLPAAAATFKQAFALDPKNAQVRANWALLAARMPGAGDAPSQMAAASGLQPTRLASDPAAPRETVSSPERVAVESGKSHSSTSGPVVNLSYAPVVGAQAPYSSIPTVTIVPSTSAVAPSRLAVEGSVHAPSDNSKEMTTAVVNLRLPAVSASTSPGTSTAIAAIPVTPRDVTSSALDASGKKTLSADPMEVAALPAKGAPVDSTAKATAARLSGSLEVSNGNGIRNAAKKVGQHLTNRGMRVVRLTNASSFDVERSAVYFRDGSLDAALALSRTLAIRPAVMLDVTMPKDTDLRLVLGRDVATHAALDSLVPKPSVERRKVAAL